jgi:hypothetical protein
MHGHYVLAKRNFRMTPPLPNDDNDISPEEIEAAADETPTDLTAPELDPQTKELTTWDEPPEAAGHAVPRVLPEDETSIAEQLVYEGTDEADRDRRIAAADPDFEP